MEGLRPVGALIIGLNAAATLSAAFTLYLYLRVLVVAASVRPPPRRLWTAALIVLMSAGCLVFFGNFAYEFHVRSVDPLTSSLAKLPIRLFYLVCCLTSGACAVAGNYHHIYGGWRTFTLWSLGVALFVALVTAYEANAG